MADNIIVSKQDASQVLRLAFDDATQALRTTASALAEQTVVQPDGSKLHVTVDASALPTGAATSAKQDDQTALLSNIDGSTSSAATSLDSIITNGIEVSSSALPTGAATETTLADLNSKFTSLGQKTGANSVPVVLANDQSTLPVSAASLPLPSGAATEATLVALSGKTSSALVSEPYDYQSLTYVAAGNGLGEIETVTYKLGGASGTLVATLTLGYDGQNRLTSVTRT